MLYPESYYVFINVASRQRMPLSNSIIYTGALSQSTRLQGLNTGAWHDRKTVLSAIGWLNKLKSSPRNTLRSLSFKFHTNQYSSLAKWNQILQSVKAVGVILKLFQQIVEGILSADLERPLKWMTKMSMFIFSVLKENHLISRHTLERRQP